MNRPEAENKFFEFVKGKRVIFVGPAPIMRDKGLGDWIDSFDIVARSNGAIFLLDEEDYRKDYGSRCDILFVNRQFSREVKKFNVDKWIKNWNLKFICGKSYSERHNQLYGNKVGIVSAEKAIRSLSNKIKGTLMGPIIMTHLLEQQPADLWFTGMDFYIDKPDKFKPGEYKEYYPGYLPKVITEKANVNNIGRIDEHDQYSNTRYLWSLVQKGKINTNPFIKELMQKVIANPDVYSVEARKKRLRQSGDL